MIKDINELNFPKYATLETATATIADMGDRTITSQVKIDGDVVPDFSYDWEVEFKGERYIHPVRTPQGTKDNTSRKAKIDMTFRHWAIHEMKRQYFVEMASTSAGTAIADKYIALLSLNLGDFITAFNLVLNHYFGGRIIINLNPEWQYDAEAKFVSISYSYIWDVLQQIHDIYEVRWTLKTNADGVCEILMGYPADEVSHIFEYGFEGGLLSVQRQVQSTDIRNRLLGRGGEKNLPYRYFKDKDPNNPLFEADPDWIPELANIAFTELRGKTFRDYVKGWKAKRYGGTVMTEPTEAYLAGYNAEKFDPIEYVEDKESIAKYGVLVGALENNEDIYPSIQGAPGEVDMIVDAEQVTDDDVDAAVENDSVTTNLESGHQTYRNAPANSTITIETLTKRYFSIPTGKVGNLDMSLTVTGKYSNVGDYEPTYPILKDSTVKITIYDKNTDAIITSSAVPVINIPAGDYYYMISAEVETNYDKISMVTLNIESVRLYVSTPGLEGWSHTFDIWVRNIWGSSRNVGETDQQYADRVWAPILGDRTGGEARVVFTSGWLSFSSDWEFPIVGYAYDDSKTDSHWRLTLAKSEAELEASGKYIPYEGYNASAGDRFFFIGIDMPHQYVLWGEERVDDYKRDRLPETARINPSWVIKTDKVRLNQDRNGAFLVDSINIGAQIRLASKQFISGAYESLYVQSITYNWTSDTILYPNVELVVSDKVATVKNPVVQMQGSIESLQRQVGSLSNIQQIIRQVCDQLYLRKDGIEDMSKSPTRFLGKVTGEKFRQGQIGGRDWGIYRDENGNAILEADKFVARQGIFVSDLVVNEATYVGGLQINSAASMKITAVEDTESGYVCYFDQQQGSVTNKFKVDDVVLCQKFDTEDNEVKFYKRRVVTVTETSVTLSKTDVNGDGIPAVDDEIIHYGNYTDKNRQFVIIRDVIGGGYERMLMGLDSVNSNGVEYYFAGKSEDSKARWFVGDENQYAKYEDGKLSIKGVLQVLPGSTGLENVLGDLNIGNQNMLRNSGFTGDYLSEPLADETVMDAAKVLYSDPLDHWHTNGTATVIDLDRAASGKGVSLVPTEELQGHLSQNLYNKTIFGESYVISFYAKTLADSTANVSVNCGGVLSKREVTGEWKKYTLLFEATSPTNEFSIYTDGEVTICDLQLERGTIATAWGMSPLDNSSDRTYYQALKYLSQALAGSTTMAGGLVLTNTILLGNESNNSEFIERAGANGLYFNDDDTPAFWAGGTMEQAIYTIAKYKDNPSYEPTEEELKSMAQFVVTHGGRAILNDAIYRGTVYSKGGFFGGRLQMPFEDVTEVCQDSGNGVYRLTTASSSHIYLSRPNTTTDESRTLYLPNDAAFDGWILDVYCLPKIGRLDGVIYVGGDGIESPIRVASGGFQTLTNILAEGGYMRFVNKDGKWLWLNEKDMYVEQSSTVDLDSFSGTYALDSVKKLIISQNSSQNSLTCTLPASPYDGQEITIVVPVKSGLIIRGNGTKIVDVYENNMEADNVSTVGSQFLGEFKFTYSKAMGRWICVTIVY